MTIARNCAAILVLLVFVAEANAAFTPIGPPWPGEPSLYELLDIRYGLANLARIDDDLDQFWFNPGYPDPCEAWAVARWTSYYPVRFFYVDPGGGPLMPICIAVGPPWDPIQIPDPALFNSDSIFALAIIPAFPDFSIPEMNRSGLDTMVTFKIISDNHPDVSPSQIGNHIVAWNHGTFSDRDYQDLVMELAGAVPVATYTEDDVIPEPSSIIVWLMLAALGIGVGRRRRRRNLL